LRRRGKVTLKRGIGLSQGATGGGEIHGRGKRTKHREVAKFMTNWLLAFGGVDTRNHGSGPAARWGKGGR